MDISLKSAKDITSLKTTCLVLPVLDGAKLTGTGSAMDAAINGRLTAVMKSEHFKGATEKSLTLLHVEGAKAERIILVGVGKADELDAAGYRKVVKSTLSAVRATGASQASVCFDEVSVKDRDAEWQLQQLAMLATEADYRYTATLSKPGDAAKLAKLVAVTTETPNAGWKNALAQGSAIGKGINVARELGNLPGNICTPTYLAKQAQALAKSCEKMSCKVLDEKDMKKLGMGALLSVTAGSAEPAKLIVIEYKGGPKAQKPHALVGKGITFDSGGISLKPGAAMDEMKFDMCGAASVLGTMTAIADIQPKMNIVAIVAACENLPSSTATKPGDVVTSMSGQTIEILNTDAEGRLILCDALTYAAKFKPASIIDIATLTGACIVALGKHASGLFSNNDEMAAELLAAGNHIHDRAWHMPLWDDYQEQLKSNFADMQNIGGPGAGSVTAACFLSRFVKDQRWAHLDIAGTAWHQGAAKGATGRPVAQLTRYLLDRLG